MRAVLSADAVTMRDPSGLKAADETLLSWPRRTAISLAHAASQMRPVSESLLDEMLVMATRPSAIDPRIRTDRRLEIVVPEELLDGFKADCGLLSAHVD